jgi:DNA/RNA-binding domain of Phe-tRNA-synthetase-like protein
MKYTITDIIETYPDINIGILIGKNIDNQRKINQLEQMQKQAIQHAQKQLKDQPPTKHPHIASWRELYRSFGTKPGDYRPSAEALIRRSIKTGKLPQINNAVDLYNIVSVTHIIPMGGFDIDKVDGDISLRFSDGDEAFTPLGPAEKEHTYRGEIVYADNSRILTRRWNYRDADQTKITSKTKNLIMFLDAAPEITRIKILEALEDLHKLYDTHCGGKYSTDIADKENPIIEL